MHDQTTAASAPEPPRPRKRRRQRPRRWTNPASPLQAERFARRQPAKQVVAALRELCPGHAGRPCKIDVSKLSDYETNNRQPSVTHIETFCRYYRKSPEDLGLINWQDTPAPALALAPGPEDSPQAQLALDWLRESVISISAAVVGALARCPLTLTDEDLRKIIGDLLSGHQAAR